MVSFGFSVCACVWVSDLRCGFGCVFVSCWFAFPLLGWLAMFVLMVLVTFLVFAAVIVWSLQGIGVMGFLGCDLDVYVVVCMLVAGMPCRWV